MKKIAFLLALALVCSISSAYAITEKDFVGTWVQEVYNKETAGYTLCVLKLTEDYNAYYTVASYEPGETKISRQSAKTWEVKGGGIHIILGEHAETDAYILKDGRLGFHLGGNNYTPYVKFGNPFAEIEDQQNGTKLSQGEYLIGEDIEPGRYKVTLVGDSAAVVWKYKAGKSTGDYYSLIYSKGETEAMIRFDEGDMLKVEHASVMLLKTEGN